MLDMRGHFELFSLRPESICISLTDLNSVTSNSLCTCLYKSQLSTLICMWHKRVAVCKLLVVISRSVLVKAQDEVETEPPPPEQMSQGEVWPLPQKIEFFSENRTVRRGSINLVFQGQRDVDCDILDFMKKTYRSLHWPSELAKEQFQTNGGSSPESRRVRIPAE